MPAPTLTPRGRLVALLLALIGACGLLGHATAAQAHATQVKPTVVLVHGAWADGSSWGDVVPELQHQGYTVFVEANPLRGLASDAGYLSAILHTVSGPIVLVGHSYGGAVITNGALGNANVKALVYVDAFIPAQGENVLQLAAAKPGSCLGGDPTANFNFVPYPGAVNNDVDLYVKPSLFPSCFANGIPADKAAVLAAAQRPLTLSAGMEASGPPAWKTIPSWALVGTKDRVIPPAELTFMAQRAHAHIVDVPAPHLSMLTAPAAVTALIVKAAHATT